MAGRFFVNDDMSSSSSESASEEEEEEQRQWVQESSSDEEEDGRIVVSHRDRNMMLVIEIATQLKKLIRIEDYSALLDHLTKAHKLITGKARMMIAKEGIPKQYSHMLCTIIDLVNSITKAHHTSRKAQNCKNPYRQKS